MATYAVPLRSDRWALLGAGPLTADAGGRAIRLATLASGSTPDNAVTAGSIEIGGNADSDDNRYYYAGSENVWARLAVEAMDPHSVTVLKDGATSAAVAPFLADKTFAVTADGDATVAAPGLLAGLEAANACTVTGIALVNMATGARTNGSVGSNLTIAGNATINVAANGGYTLTLGTAYDTLKGDETAQFQIEITITDGTNSLTDKALATWTVTGVNDAPTAPNRTKAVNEGAVATGNFLTDSTAASHPQSEPLMLTKINGAVFAGGLEQRLTHGFLAASGNGAYTYRPTVALAAAATVQEVITYTVADRFGASDDGTLTITITGV